MALIQKVKLRPSLDLLMYDTSSIGVRLSVDWDWLLLSYIHSVQRYLHSYFSPILLSLRIVGRRDDYPMITYVPLDVLSMVLPREKTPPHLIIERTL